MLPVFDGLGMGEEARAYRASVIERFRNPFLDHKLADIFTNHAAKKQRRFGGLVALAEQHGIVGRPAAPQGGARGLRRAVRRRRAERSAAALAGDGGNSPISARPGA